MKKVDCEELKSKSNPNFSLSPYIPPLPFSFLPPFFLFLRRKSQAEQTNILHVSKTPASYIFPLKCLNKKQV